MTVESDVFDALKTLVSNRVYPDVAPAGAVRPYITYQQVGGTSVVFLESAVASKKNGRFQINCWAETRLAASALSLQAESALVTSTAIQVTPFGSPVAAHEPDVLLYGTRQDFSIWSNR